MKRGKGDGDGDGDWGGTGMGKGVEVSGNEVCLGTCVAWSSHSKQRVCFRAPARPTSNPPQLIQDEGAADGGGESGKPCASLAVASTVPPLLVTLPHRHGVHGRRQLMDGWTFGPSHSGVSPMLLVVAAFDAVGVGLPRQSTVSKILPPTYSPTPLPKMIMIETGMIHCGWHWFISNTTCHGQGPITNHIPPKALQTE
jgi:hypothetical protein